MAAYTVSGSRLLPLHISQADESNIGTNLPQASIQSITMGIRVGVSKYAIGYIHKFTFEMKRDNKTIYQIEPYPDVLGDNQSASGIKSTFTDTTFNEDTLYWPGEAIEIIPGKMGVIDITLDRYSVYTANLMAAMLRASGSGVYAETTAQAAGINPHQATEPIAYVNILQQVRPFDIYQIFVSPLTGGVLWGRKFGGCWFTSVGETTPESDRNEPVMENGKIQATYMRPLTSSLSATA